MNAYEKLLEPVCDRSAWRADDLRASSSWIYRLSDRDVTEVHGALEQVKKAGLAMTNMDDQDFPLPGLGPRLKEILSEIESGRGLVLIKGVPVKGYAEDDVCRIYWGIMRYFGSPITQNTKGEFIGHVRDVGLKWGEVREGERVRGYLTTELLPFHSDNTDLVGLLCLNAARMGGTSSIVSAVSIFNEVLENYPEHLDQLCEGFNYSLRGEQKPGMLPYTKHRVPVFSYFGKRLSCGYVRKGIEQGAEDRGVPLSDRERSAMDIIDMLAKRDDLRLDMELEPGDLQILNNYTTFHSRSQFVDYDEPEKKRHLLRMWLRSKVRRPLAQEFANRYGTDAPYRPLEPDGKAA